MQPTLVHIYFKKLVKSILLTNMHGLVKYLCLDPAQIISFLCFGSDLVIISIRVLSIASDRIPNANVSASRD